MLALLCAPNLELVQCKLHFSGEILRWLQNKQAAQTGPHFIHWDIMQYVRMWLKHP